MAAVETAADKYASARGGLSDDLLAAKQALTESQSENAEVRTATEEVTRRLDGVIERLKAVLKE